ncbi:uncharacterized protein PHALS_02810 [Plasmopara halstedii]|uniref:Uncharacterized protein n=1 Tax=Plasmopara halstedii TaxID=4781 RepID=A0A0P1AZ00_PLAHL|nr:uncharacterized protein PHALS_02810 [Plasmopara halstedii]CEG46407.1 hypothetical protein PHALS_02810 [Plasmopara halstedii]|eukprot:XP_024582776.1 hypothetical protein PHALS_02810 [Plasmopara halstedii]
MECEMVLLAMLPEKEGVILVQTPRVRTIAELENLIVDEYSRVFPQLPPLSRNLRIQKCVALELVLDRRAHTTARQQAPHVFVDLAKNVQIGNVFQNMEQIYIVVNELEQLTHPATVRKATDLHIASTIAKSSVQGSGVVATDTHINREDAVEKMASKKTAAEKKKRTSKKLASDSENRIVTKKTDEVENNYTRTMTDEAISASKKISLKSVKTVAGSESYDKSNVVAEEKHGRNGLKKHRCKMPKSVEENYGLQLTTKTTVKDVGDVAEKTSRSTKVTEDKNSLSPSGSKKAISKKSENALLKKMLAAKHDAASSGAALVANSLSHGGSDVAPKAPFNSEKKRKSTSLDTSKADITSNSCKSPAKKKRKSEVIKTKVNRASKVIDENMSARSTKIKGAAELRTKATPTNMFESEKGSKKNMATKVLVKANDDSSTASESTSPTSNLKKIKNDATRPVTKRAKKPVTTAIPADKKSESVAKVSKISKGIGSGTISTPNDVSRSSPRLSTLSTQAGELITGQEPESGNRPALKATAVRSAKQDSHDEITSEGPKSRFQTILEKTKKRLAQEKEANDNIQGECAEAKNIGGNVKETSNSARKMLIQSLSDSDASVGVKVTKRFSKFAAPVESSSSSSSDDDELAYSQGLLADLTKNDTGEELLTPVLAKENKNSKKENVNCVVSLQEQELPQNMLSSDLPQKLHESNSVLLPILTRNQFSIGKLSVAKLKKSSKNPFSSL